MKCISHFFFFSFFFLLVLMSLQAFIEIHEAMSSLFSSRCPWQAGAFRKCLVFSWTVFFCLESGLSEEPRVGGARCAFCAGRLHTQQEACGRALLKEAYVIL